MAGEDFSGFTEYFSKYSVYCFHTCSKVLESVDENIQVIRLHEDAETHLVLAEPMEPMNGWDVNTILEDYMDTEVYNRRLIYVKYDRNLVATIIENEFWDDLYNEIDDSVMNMEGQELDEAFETYVDYAKLDQIENVKVVRVEQEEDDTCTIVRGILEADVSLDGYVYFEGENNMVNSSEVTLNSNFNLSIRMGKSPICVPGNCITYN